jgi:SecD/SecF fusion protein
MVALVLFIFGGEVIRGFTFALLVGIVFGTYSSIAIATPIVVDFDRKKAK